ncbi:putative thioredoxin [Athelia psychrophila]|uniref:Thioredoxin n=1 Tax=Athelia psychrophila TaxID=1759441 RepID=A0A166NT25_9AGAM|nr:putative thioredoxin [Fibularhizoctonia sp. CBS 109695]
MSLTQLTSLAQLNALLDKPDRKLTVIDFHAAWCGPCRMISPVFERLSSEDKYSNINFLKCDVDACGDISTEYGIRSLPTFMFFKGNTKVDDLSGPNPRHVICKS